MTVNDVVTQLKYGELRSIAIKDDVPAIVSYINLALIALYGRFKLSRGEKIIDLVDNVSIYPLNDDTMYVEAVYNEEGTELAINDDDNLDSVFLPSFNQIQVPNAATGGTISVLYVQSPTSIVPGITDNLTLAMNVALPSILLEPLLHYVGYRAHGSMNGDIKAENNTHYMRYEASCKRVKDLGLIREDVVPAKVNTAEGISHEQD